MARPKKVEEVEDLVTDDMVEVIATRVIGVPSPGSPGGSRPTVEGEKVSIPREMAKKLQDSGAVKVVL